VAVLVPSSPVKRLDLVDLVVAGYLALFPQKFSYESPVDVERCSTPNISEVVEVVFFRHPQLPLPERVEVAQRLVLPLQS